MVGTGALPARFRRERVLVIGCGDVGLRCARALGAGDAPLGALARVKLLALTSQPGRRTALREAGVQPLLGNLDDPSSLRRLAGLATRVLYLAPPPTGDGTGTTDPRSVALARALLCRQPLSAFVYASTTGVYGDCAGAWVDETRALQPQTTRAKRRVMAENTWQQWGRVRQVPVGILRIPGIYAPDRPHGSPRERVVRGMPVLQTEDDVFTNHIHADDLARACVRALWLAPRQRVYNVSDDQQQKMGDYFDGIAVMCGLPKLPRISRDEAQKILSPMTLSFMGESRRMVNTRMKQELGVVLHHPVLHPSSI
jgi:nucleoside-diphosphate-sugar epimerase